VRNISMILVAILGVALAGCPQEADTTTQADEAPASTGDEAAPAEEAAPVEGHPASPFHAEGVEIAVENQEGGVSVTFTAEDAALVPQLQEFAAKHAAGTDTAEGHGSCPHACPCTWEGVTTTAENLDNGVRMTLAAEDADTVTRMQEYMASKAEGGCCGHGHGKGHAEGHGSGDAEHPWAVLHADAVTRTVENLDNGVKVLFSSGCPHHQGLVQEAAKQKVEHMAERGEAAEGHGCPHKKDSPFHHASVTATAGNTETGAAISFVSDDAEIVPQLQQYAAEKVSGEGCGCEHH